MEMILYSELNMLCIAVLLMIYYNDAKRRNNDETHILFTRVLFSNILFFASDIIWGLLSLSDTPFVAVNWIANIAYFSLSGITGFFWLNFVENKVGYKVKRKKFYYFICAMPAILLTALSLISYKTHWLFYIDAAGHYARGDFYFLQPTLAYVLPIYATIRAIVATIKTPNFEKKRQFRSIAMFYIMPCIGGIMQVIVAGTPTLNIGITLSGLWIYFTFQDNIIMLDPLTAMNNRRFFDNSLHSLIRGYDTASKETVWLIIMDIDYFKKINDGFGHAQGDAALIAVAGVLKEVCGKYNCFSARIGGDEFAVCCSSHDKNIVDIVCDEINVGLKSISARLPFRITMCIGYAEYSEKMTAQQLFVDADKQLYDMKAAR